MRFRQIREQLDGRRRVGSTQGRKSTGRHRTPLVRREVPFVPHWGRLSDRYSPPSETTSPPSRVARSCQVAREIVSLRNRAWPSTKRTFAPSAWRLLQV